MHITDFVNNILISIFIGCITNIFVYLIESDKKHKLLNIRLIMLN